MPLVIGDMAEVTMVGGTMVGGTMDGILRQVIRVRLATDGIRTRIPTVSCLPERDGRAVTLENVC